MDKTKFDSSTNITFLDTNIEIYFCNVVIHQPNLFPNIKVLQKICSGDVWIILDDAQFVKREWQNRCKARFFKNPESEFWINLQIVNPNGYDDIKNIKISNYRVFKDDTYRKLIHAYSCSKNWNFLSNYLEKIFSYEFDNLSEFSIFSILALFELLEININVVSSSDYCIEKKRTKRLVELSKKVNAKNYISGLGGHNYMDESLFSKENINVIWHEWDNPKYNDKYDNLN